MRRLLPAAAILVCALLPAAAAGDHLDRLLDEERELLSLYFGEEQMVEAATRHPKPISQVAENVTVITAAEIEAMHAHTVAEVLERVPGVFVSFLGRDLASPSSLSIHGSDYEHVLVLVDGIRWNAVGSDFAETNQIPVQIIERIEVIKGAASSAWGSALGGVVNIITKESGRTRQSTGSAALAVGEHGAIHYHGEAAGRVDDFGYYLFAGRRQSDGIRDGRFFEDTNLFGKFSYQLSGTTRLDAGIGYSRPEYRHLYFREFDEYDEQDGRLRFYSASLDSSLASDLHFHLQVYGRGQRLTNTTREISSGAILGGGKSWSTEDEQRGINSRLVRQSGAHTLVVGVEYLHRQVSTRDPVAGLAPPTLSEEILALYLNDTIRLANFTVTPGLRYDRLSIGDDQVSPSLGVTYRLGRETTLRAAAARGFRKPTLDLKETPAGASVFGIASNPELESETIGTYQVGFETTAIPHLWLQTTLFRHEASDVWGWQWNESLGWIIANEAKVNRTGLEAALRTVPFHDFSLGVNYAFVNIQPDEGKSDNLYKVNLLLEYQNRDRGLLAQLFGNYAVWQKHQNGEFSTVIWDFTLRQRLPRFSENLEAELFFKAHNLFNGEHYWHPAYPNAPRWLEAGLTVRF